LCNGGSGGAEPAAATTAAAAAAQAEKLNLALQQQLNLEAVKTRAISLFKAITRILEDFDAYARTNTTPKWSFPCSSFLFFFTHNAHDLPAVWRVAQT
jgi:hypothetical protein